MASSSYTSTAASAMTSHTGTTAHPTHTTTNTNTNTNNPNNKYFDYLFKLLLIGDTSVGKTCAMLRLSDDTFTSNFISTIGIDFKIKTINLDGKRIKLQIWDTAGQDRFRTITRAYYRGAHGIFLVYDVTNAQSFQNIKTWMQNIQAHASPNVEVVLLGNKCDLVDKRVITPTQGAKVAVDYNIRFFETSCKANINVTEAFTAMCRGVKDRLPATQPSAADSSAVTLVAEPVATTGRCC